MRFLKWGLRCALAASAMYFTAEHAPVQARTLPAVRGSSFSSQPSAQLEAFLQAPAAATDAKGDIVVPDAPGRDVTKRLCAGCHSNNVWAGQRHTREKWNSIVDNMVSKGLEASDDELATISDYLATNLAPEPAKPAPSTGAPPPAQH